MLFQVTQWEAELAWCWDSETGWGSHCWSAKTYRKSYFQVNKMYRNHTFTGERAHNTFTWLSPAHSSCICHALPKEGRPRLWLLLINFSAWLNKSPTLLSPIPGHLPHIRVYNGPMQEQPVETSICTIRSFLPVCLPVPHLTALSWPLTGPLMGLRLNHSEFFFGEMRWNFRTWGECERKSERLARNISSSFIP